MSPSPLVYGQFNLFAISLLSDMAEAYKITGLLFIKRSNLESAAREFRKCTNESSMLNIPKPDFYPPKEELEECKRKFFIAMCTDTKNEKKT